MQIDNDIMNKLASKVTKLDVHDGTNKTLLRFVSKELNKVLKTIMSLVNYKKKDKITKELVIYGLSFHGYKAEESSEYISMDMMYKLVTKQCGKSIQWSQTSLVILGSFVEELVKEMFYKASLISEFVITSKNIRTVLEILGC